MAGQLTYSQFHSVAQAGQIADLTDCVILSLPAAETIHAGRFVEMASDGLSIQELQHTGSTCNPVGLAVLTTAREGAGAVGISPYGLGGSQYVQGETVPVMIRGAAYAAWSGTTQGAWAKPNLYHSSTTETNRGKVTDAGTSTTAGSEVAAAPSGIRVRQAMAGTGPIVLVDINFPGAA